MADIEELVEQLSERQNKTKRQQNPITSFVRRLWHGGIGAILLFLICLLMGWIIHFPLSKMHSSATKMEILFNKEVEGNRNNNVSYEIVGEITGWHTTTNKYDEVAIMMSRPVIEQMLRSSFVFDSAVMEKVQRLGHHLSSNDSIELMQSLVERNVKRIEVTFADPTKMKKNSIVTITMEGGEEKNKQILLDLVESYNAYTRAYNDLCYRRTVNFLKYNIDSIRHELDQIDAFDEQFSESNFIVDMGRQSSTYLDVDRDDEASIRDMQLQRELLKIIRQYMIDMDKNYVVVPANTGIEDQQINRIVIEFNDLVMRRSNYLTSMGEDAMRVRTISAQIEDQREAIIISIDKLTQAFDIRLAKYEKNKKESEDRLRTMPHKRIVKDKIDRERAIITPLYTHLQQKLIETIIAWSAEQDQARIVTPPYTVETSMLKSSKNIYLLSILLGVILAIIYMCFLELPHEKVDIGDVLKDCPLPIWGILPSKKGKQDLYQTSLQAVLTRIKMSGAKRILLTCGYAEDYAPDLKDDLEELLAAEGLTDIVLYQDGDYHTNPKLPELSSQSDATIYTIGAGLSRMRSMDFIGYALDEGLLYNGAVIVTNAKTNKALPINFGAFDYEVPKGFDAVRSKAKK